MSPLLVVVLIVLVDLMGFTIVMPLLPRLAESRGFSPTQIGFLFAAYPLCQLVAGPILGRLSDKYGRRPVLAVSQFGTALSFVILAATDSFPIMLLGRMLDGASGGNILVAQAYVADITKPEHRSRSLGLIGAAFGVGFVLGPLLCGLLLKLPVSDTWLLRVPFLVAAGFSTSAWLLVLFWLPESSSKSQARVLSWRGIGDILADPRIGGLVGVGGLFVLAFAVLEGTFSLFLKARMRWTAEQSAYAFVALGFVSALIQGGLIRRLIPRFGESRLMILGLSASIAGFAAIASASDLLWLLGAIVLAGIGQGLTSPTVQGLLSRISPDREQGAIFGTLSSAQMLARLIAYVAANRLLDRLGPAAPYWAASGIAALSLALAAWVVRMRIGSLPAKEPLPQVAAEAVGP